MPDGSGPRLVPVHGSVLHASLLPHCAVVVQHGGAGTTGAVMRSGVPQVVCPVQFDQYFWVSMMRLVW